MSICETDKNCIASLGVVVSNDIFTWILSTITMRFGKKPLSDLDNRVIINCGGVRHESYKVLEEIRQWATFWREIDRLAINVRISQFPFY